MSCGKFSPDNWKLYSTSQCGQRSGPTDQQPAAPCELRQNPVVSCDIWHGYIYILQVDGFRYECSIKDKNFEANLNISENTATCLIQEGVSISQVHSGSIITLSLCVQMLEISSGEETVPLELIWTNDTVSYALSRNPTDIMC